MAEKLEDLVSLTTRIPREQHEALRKLSFDTRESIAKHIRRAIDLYLETPDHDILAEIFDQIPELYGDHVKDGELTITLDVNTVDRIYSQIAKRGN